MSRILHYYWMHQVLALLWVVCIWLNDNKSVILISLGVAVFHSCMAVVHINQWRKKRVERLLSKNVEWL